ncbi:MAG TPA: metallophosphoesterase, partial [Steroidobacteraceae bacterium]|nr:metallophosphoesterase [Steroidobacteraceae bacterium]
RFVDLVAAPAAVVIPGNHDIPLFNLAARVLSPYGGYRRAFGDELEPSYAAADLLVLAVNTTRARRHKDGEVSPEQVARVERRLRSALSAQLRVVVVHQPVMAVRIDDETNLLHGRADAVRAWVAAGADLVMGGHIHWPYACSLRMAYSDLPRDAWVVQAGTAVSSRVRDGVPNSVNVVRTTTASASSRRCILERWDYDAAADRFGLVERHHPTFS